jgi:hypothetical protein
MNKSPHSITTGLDGGPFNAVTWGFLEVVEGTKLIGLDPPVVPKNVPETLRDSPSEAQPIN